MSAASVLERKIRAFLDGLSPGARDSLRRRLATAVERGEADSTVTIALAALGGPETSARAAVARDTGPAPAADPPPEPDVAGKPWPDRLRALVLAPLDPFLCDEAEMPLPAWRVSRGSLEAIWAILVDDIVARQFGLALAKAPPPVDEPALARHLREAAAAEIRRRLEDVARQPRGPERLAMRLGGEVGYESLRRMAAIFAVDATLALVLGASPPVIGAADLQNEAFLTACREAVQQRGLDPHLLGTALLPRLADPVLAVDLALRLVGGQPARAGEPAPRGVVQALTGEVAWLVRAAARDGQRPAGLGALPRRIALLHRVVRAVNTHLEPETVPGLAAELAALRRDLSAVVGAALDGLPGLLRRAFRGDGRERDGGAGPDPFLIDDTLLRLKIYAAARQASESLAINELLSQLVRTLEPTLELLIERTFADYGKAGPRGLEQHDRAADMLVQCAAPVFGEAFAAALARRRAILRDRLAGDAPPAVATPSSRAHVA